MTVKRLRAMVRRTLLVLHSKLSLLSPSKSSSASHYLFSFYLSVRLYDGQSTFPSLPFPVEMLHLAYVSLIWVLHIIVLRRLPTPRTPERHAFVY